MWSLLGDANYLRIWMIGGLTGVTRWLEMLALGIFTFDLTGSPFLVALLPVLRLMPLSLFGLIVGTYAERLDRRLVMVGSLVFVTLISAVMLTLTVTDGIAFWHIAVSTLLAGIFWCTDMPVRRRLVGDVAGEERLAPAMGLDSATNNATRMIGPLVGGITYAMLGIVGVYALSTIAYAVCALLAIGLTVGRSSNDPREADGAPPPRILADLGDTFRHALGDRNLICILLVTIVFNIWVFPFTAMLPVLGKEIWHLDASWVGIVSSIEGLGAFLGALTIASIGRPSFFIRIYFFGTAVNLVLIFALGFLDTVAPAATVLLLIGLGSACFSTMQSTLIYLVAPPDMKSRAFGLLSVCIGSGLIGFSHVGLMAEWFGAPMALRIISVEGLAALLLVAVYWRELRHPYAPPPSGP